MSEVTKRQVATIIANRRAMASAFEKHGIPPKFAGEFAFHLADIKDELAAVGKTLDKICKSKSCSAKDFDRLVSCVAIHWAYHAVEARKVMDRADRAKARKEKSNLKRVR